MDTETSRVVDIHLPIPEEAMSAYIKTNNWRFVELSNPTRFMKLAECVLPWLAFIGSGFLALGLWLAFTVPPDYKQGNMVRIMFIHVPAVMMAMATYMVMVSSALGALVWRHPLADVAAKSAAPIGAIFAFVGLVTGSIWGKPMWGTWWAWDARLTSFLILFFMFGALIALWRAIEEPCVAAKLAGSAVLAGALILPIIHYSVDWWSVLHQPNGTLLKVDIAFRLPLWIMMTAFAFIFAVFHLMLMRNELLARRIRTMQRNLAKSADSFQDIRL